MHCFVVYDIGNEERVEKSALEKLQNKEDKH